MPLNPNRLQGVKLHTHCHNFYNGECCLPDSICVCSKPKTDSKTGKQFYCFDEFFNGDLCDSPCAHCVTPCETI
jgi:hypothetical protein